MEPEAQKAPQEVEPITDTEVDSPAATGEKSNTTDSSDNHLSPNDGYRPRAESFDVGKLLEKLEQQNRLLEADERAIVLVEDEDSVNASLADMDDSVNMSQITTARNSPDLDATSNKLWQWGEVLGSFETFAKKKPKRLTEMVMAGVPDAVRGKVWENLALLKAAAVASQSNSLLTIRSKSNSVIDEPVYSELLELNSPHEKLIRRDIARTYPQHDMFSEREGLGQEVLFNVIKAYSLYDLEVGYCQGSPFIVGILLMHMPEEEAFILLTQLMRDYKLRALFRPSMADLPLRLYQLDCLIQQTYPQLHCHFAEMGLIPSSYASQWFLTLFGSTLPLPLVFRIVDIFFLEGTPVIFRAALALLGHNHDFLIRQNFEGAIGFLSRNGIHDRYVDNEQSLIDVIQEIKVPAKRLAKFEKDYIAMKNKEKEEANELVRVKAQMERLKEENKTLVDKVQTLEKETGKLAEKLLEISVKLHKRDEEVFDLQQEIAEHLRVSERASEEEEPTTPSEPVVAVDAIIARDDSIAITQLQSAEATVRTAL